MIQAFKPRLYLVWTVLTGLFFGAANYILYQCLSTSILETSSLFIKVAVAFGLLVLLLASISAPYTYAACKVSEEALFLPVSNQAAFSTGTTDEAILHLLFLPFVLWATAFLPSLYVKVKWNCIQQASIQKKWWGEVLFLEVSETKGIRRHTISWPLADTTGFQNTILNQAPEDHPLSELMQTFSKNTDI